VSGALRIPAGSDIDAVLSDLDQTAAPRVVDASPDPSSWADGFGGMLTEFSTFDSTSPSNFSAELPAGGWSDYLHVAAMPHSEHTFAQDRGTFAFELLAPTTRADVESYGVSYGLRSLHRLPLILAQGRFRLHHPTLTLHFDSTSRRPSYSLYATLLAELKSTTLTLDVYGGYLGPVETRGQVRSCTWPPLLCD
jgi:hypothetical protein